MPKAPATAVDVAAKALARRELTAFELRARLARAGFDEVETADAIEALRDRGYLSDERAARERARVLAERALGDHAIAEDLRRRGIGRDMVDEIVASLPPESTRAERLVARLGPGPRLAATLARKGYGEDTIAGVARPGIADGP